MKSIFEEYLEWLETEKQIDHPRVSVELIGSEAPVRGHLVDIEEAAIVVLDGGGGLSVCPWRNVSRLRVNSIELVQEFIAQKQPKLEP